MFKPALSLALEMLGYSSSEIGLILHIANTWTNALDSSTSAYKRNERWAWNHFTIKRIYQISSRAESSSKSKVEVITMSQSSIRYRLHGFEDVHKSLWYKWFWVHWILRRVFMHAFHVGDDGATFGEYITIYFNYSCISYICQHPLLNTYCLCLLCEEVQSRL